MKFASSVKKYLQDIWDPGTDYSILHWILWRKWFRFKNISDFISVFIFKRIVNNNVPVVVFAQCNVYILFSKTRCLVRVFRRGYFLKQAHVPTVISASCLSSVVAVHTHTFLLHLMFGCFMYSIQWSNSCYGRPGGTSVECGPYTASTLPASILPASTLHQCLYDIMKIFITNYSAVSYTLNLCQSDSQHYNT